MERILDFGCPAEFNWEEPAENKMAALRRGNSPTIAANMPVVDKTLPKEVNHSHLAVYSPAK